jgi:hypothetical protein
MTTISTPDHWFVTQDGSLSWHDPDVGQAMHNRAGAYSEAHHLYVQPLLTHNRNKPLNAFAWIDGCFGLGYNTWAWLQTLLHTTSAPFNLCCHAIELDPAMWQRCWQIVNQPCFLYLKQKLAASEHKVYYQTSGNPHPQPWTIGSSSFTDALFGLCNVAGLTRFTWQVSHPAWGQFQMTGHYADLMSGLASIPPVHHQAVFHDAYSPTASPTLWASDVFKGYARLLALDGAVLTYSQARVVKTALSDAGLHWEKTAVTLGGKHGGLIATHPQEPNNC